jgi:hypothetical protein
MRNHPEFLTEQLWNWPDPGGRGRPEALKNAQVVRENQRGLPAHWLVMVEAARHRYSGG